MDFDEVFDYIGHFGVYQLCVYLLLGLPSYYSGYQNIAMSFLGPYHEHWCEVDCLTNYSYDTQKNVSIPWDEEEPEEYAECIYYDLDYCSMSSDDILNWDRETDTANATIAECKRWVYSQEEFTKTAVSEYDLVCDDEYLVTLASSIYLGGILIGAPLSGVLSDNFGRKPILILGSIGHFIFGLSAAFMPGYWAFAILRFFLSTFNAFAYLCAFVIVMEVIGPKYRSEAGVIYQIIFSVGFMLLPGMSYFVRDFQYLQLLMVIQVVVCICYFWLVPESPRWLLSQNKEHKAMDILQKIARTNGKSLPPDTKIHSKKDESGDEQHLGIWTIFRHRVLCKQLLICYLGWFTSSLVYYGLSLNTGDLAGSVFLNTFLSGLVEVPANILAIFTLKYGGRRPTLAWSFIVAGVASFLCIPLLENDDLAWLVTTFSMIGKAGITICFTAIYIFTAEMFPTPVRHVAVGTSSMVSRVGGLLAPFMGDSLMSVWTPLPSTIFGVFGVASGLLTFLLPETLNKKLPDSIEEAEELGRVKPSQSTKALVTDSSALSVVDDGQKQGTDNPAYQVAEGIDTSTSSPTVIKDTLPTDFYLESNDNYQVARL